jgi:hypothetical protein
MNSLTLSGIVVSAGCCATARHGRIADMIRAEVNNHVLLGADTISRSSVFVKEKQWVESFTRSISPPAE